MLIANQIPALYNGVSQQPPTLRSPTQCEAQVNGWATIVDGLQKRSPSEFVAKLSDVALDGAYMHEINRDTTQRYIVVLTSGSIKVYDLDGVEQTVIMSAPEYLTVPAGQTAKTNFALVTVADYTFVVNKSTVVDLDAVGADSISQSLDSWWLNRAKETDGGGAQQLQYPPNPPSTYGSWSKVQSFQKLPETAAHGTLYEITGTDESGFTTYYVRRDGGIWNECVRPNLRNLIKPSTMPHALVRRPDGVFEFAPFSWAPRRVGDEQTNPHPTFVGRTIRDVFFYKNRLGFVVEENCVLSRAGDFGVFHRMTVLDVLADDVVDVAASDTKVTKFNFAVPFQTSMMLFSDQVQFRLNHNGIVSPSTMSIDVATQYETLTTVRPVPLGTDVYFASENGEWATLREYYVREQNSNTEAANLTGHVPRYLPAGVTRLIAGRDHDVIFTLTDGAPNRIYVYKFYWQDDTAKAQSAWHYWEMSPDDVILSGTVLDNFLYLVIQRHDGVYLERIALDSGTKAPGLPFQVYLDRRTKVQGTYLPEVDQTEFELPYAVRPEDRSRVRVVLGGQFTTQKGALVGNSGHSWHPTDNTVIRVPGNVGAKDVFVGFAYDFRFTFSEQFMKTNQGVPVTTGRLQLRSYTVYYTDTAFFRTEVAPYGVNPEVETIIPAKLAEFTGKTLGDASLTLGEPSFHEGSFTFQIYGDSDVATVTLSNDSHLSCNFQSAEWEGFYQNRARLR